MPARPPWAIRLTGGEPGPAGPDAEVEVTALAEGAEMEGKRLGDFLAAFEGLFLDAEGAGAAEAAAAVATAGGGVCLLDQPFFSGHGGGRLSVNMVYDSPVEIVHVREGDGTSGARSFRSYPPNAVQFEGVVSRLCDDLPRLMGALGLEGAALPPIWAVDFHRAGDDPACADYRYQAFHCDRVGLQDRLHLALHVAHAVLKLCRRAPPPLRPRDP